MSRRKPPLSPEDIALWRHVARAVTPLPGRTLPDCPPAKTPKPADHAAALKATVAAPVPIQPKPRIKPIVPIERRVRTALRRGTADVDGVLDLHGMTQDVAHHALVDFLYRMRAQGSRTLLVITGKGAISGAGSGLGAVGWAPGEERGVLRRLVPHWLRLPDLRPLVLSVEEASDRHGGSGALYVRLRRHRDPAP